MGTVGMLGDTKDHISRPMRGITAGAELTARHGGLLQPMRAASQQCDARFLASMGAISLQAPPKPPGQI